MGWSYYCDPARGRDYLINKISSPGYLAQGYEMLEHRVVGNNIWYLYKTPEGLKTIGLTLIKSGGRGSGWGEKGLNENAGPRELNCPLSLLNKADPPKADSYAAEWREKVRKFHDNIKAQKAVWSSMQVGTKLTIGRDKYTVQSLHYMPKHMVLIRESDGVLFRHPRRNFHVGQIDGFED